MPRRQPRVTVTGLRVVVGLLVTVLAVGALMAAMGDPTPGSVLAFGGGTLAYLLASFGSEGA
jgi:hypothetical protein